MSGRFGWTALVSLVLLALSPAEARAQGPPDGQLTIAFDASIAPAFLDPAETAGLGTPFVFLYALHDALIKPLPGNDMAPCLAESWRESAGRAHLRLQAAGGPQVPQRRPLHRRGREVQLPALPRRLGQAAARSREGRWRSSIPHRVRFVLHKPWPDFLVFYATPATGAAWIVPKKYIEKVGEDGFKRQPVGLGPVSLRAHGPGPGARARGQRAVLAEEAVDQARRHQGRSRPHHAPGHAEDRRGGHRLPDGRRRGGDDQGRPQAPPRPGHPVRDLVGGVPRAVEAQVALARPPRAARREPRHRQEGHQRGGAPGLFAPDRLDHPEHHGLRAAHRALSLRPRARQAPPRRGRLSRAASTPAT